MKVLKDFWLKVGPIRLMALSRWVLEVFRYRERIKKPELGSFQWCPVPSQDANGTDWNTGDSLSSSRSISVLCGSWSTGTVLTPRAQSTRCSLLTLQKRHSFLLLPLLQPLLHRDFPVQCEQRPFFLDNSVQHIVHATMS